MSLARNLAIIILILLVSACGDKSTDPTTIQLDAIPLDIGTKWNFRIDLLSIGDSSYQDSTIAYRIYTIVSDTAINGIDMVLVDDTLLSIRSWGLDTLVYRYWLGMAESRLMMYATDYNPSDNVPPSFDPTPNTMLDFPLTWGKVWADPNIGFISDTCRVIGYEAVVAAGEERQCWVVETVSFPYNHLSERRHDWYSGIGLVKSETLQNQIRKQWILIDYFPANR